MLGMTDVGGGISWGSKCWSVAYVGVAYAGGAIFRGMAYACDYRCHGAQRLVPTRHSCPWSYNYRWM